jgi:hypothetical protein
VITTYSDQKLVKYWARFFHHLNSWLLVVFVLASVVIKLTVYSVTFNDLIIVAALVFIQPFGEWLVHITLLHLRPIKVGRFKFELHVAKVHRLHHEDPKNEKLVFIPTSIIIFLISTVLIVDYLFFAFNISQMLTAFSMSLSLIFFYEWVHFLIHSSYRPKHSPYKLLYKIHRLHHYKNEHYWFGVTNHLADIIFGTFPNPSHVKFNSSFKKLISH